MKEKLLKLASLAIEVTENTKADVFFYYSGHIKQASLGIHEKGWKSEEVVNTIFIRNESDADAMIEKLEALRNAT